MPSHTRQAVNVWVHGSKFMTPASLLRQIDHFFKADHAIIVPLTVKDILEEQLARKLI